MRKLTTITAIALLMASSASAIADGTPSLKDQPVAAPAPAWDIAFGGNLASDYMFRGISQSANWPSGSAYAEFRYNIQPTIQLYSGISIESIDYPNRAASETDFYFGVRPTFDKLALDFGGWYYWYPGGRSLTAQLNRCSNRLSADRIPKYKLHQRLFRRPWQLQRLCRGPELLGSLRQGNLCLHRHIHARRKRVLRPFLAEHGR